MTTHAHHESEHQHGSQEAKTGESCTCCRVCELQHQHDMSMSSEERGDHAGHGEQGGHQGHADHTNHEIMFRNRFWIILVLSAPVLIYSESIQSWFNYTAPVFPAASSSSRYYPPSSSFMAACPFYAWQPGNCAGANRA